MVYIMPCKCCKAILKSARCHFFHFFSVCHRDWWLPLLIPKAGLKRAVQLSQFLFFCLVIVSALVTAQVAAFPGGAPRSACASMAPIHMLFGAQQDTVPFTLSISSAQANSVSPITVTLQSTGEAEFRGYMIQARSGTNTTGIGSFSAEGSQGKTMDCPGGTANAVTHSSRVRRKNETFLWTPPADFKGQVAMKATVVVGFRTFYTDLQSAAITIV